MIKEFKEKLSYFKKFKILKPLIYFLLFLISPQGLIFLLATLILTLSFSFAYVFGPVNNENLCLESGVPNLSSFEEDKQEEVLIGYFGGENNISKISAGYLATIIGKNPNWHKSKNIPQNCDSKCLLELYNKNKFVNITLGPIDLKGTKAKRLLERAVNSNKEWYDEEIYLSTIKNLVNELSSKKYSIKDEKKKRQAIKDLSNYFNKPLNNKQIQDLLKSIEEKTKEIKGDITGCVSMGKGGNKGRLDGGGAKDSNVKSGNLNLEDLLELLESYHTEQKILVHGSYGENLATPEMIEVKRIAMEKDTSADGEGLKRLYASCDRNVAMALKATEIDTSFPWGNVAMQVRYMETHPQLWQEVHNKCDRQSGDIITWGGTG